MPGEEFCHILISGTFIQDFQEVQQKPYLWNHTLTLEHFFSNLYFIELNHFEVQKTGI